MDKKRARYRLLFLIIAHLVIAIPLAILVGPYSPWRELYYLIAASQFVLIAIATGFSNTSGWTRCLIFILGTVWETFVLVTPDRPQLEVLWLPFAILVLCNVAIVIPLGLYRRYRGRVEWSAEWPAKSTYHPTQFTVRSMLMVTTVVGILLAFGKFVRNADGDFWWVLVFIPTIAISVLIGIGLILWACLRTGSLRLRLPVAIVGSAVVGLIPPFNLGGTKWDFPISALIAFVVAIVTSCSLLFVRGGGYRLIPVEAR